MGSARWRWMLRRVFKVWQSARKLRVTAASGSVSQLVQESSCSASPRKKRGDVILVPA